MSEGTAPDVACSMGAFSANVTVCDSPWVDVGENALAALRKRSMKVYERIRPLGYCRKHCKYETGQRADA